MRRLWTVSGALATLSLTNCGYNAIQTNDEQVKSNWSEVVNQYQRRADLCPIWSIRCKGFCRSRKYVLLASPMPAPRSAAPGDHRGANDPAAFSEFTAAQG